LLVFFSEGIILIQMTKPFATTWLATGLAVAMFWSAGQGGPAYPKAGPSPGAADANRPPTASAASQFRIRGYAANPNLFTQGMEGVAGWSRGGAYGGNNTALSGGFPVVARVQVVPVIHGVGGGRGGGGGGRIRCVTVPTPMNQTQELVRRFFRGAGLNF